MLVGLAGQVRFHMVVESFDVLHPPFFLDFVDYQVQVFERLEVGH